MLQLPNVHKIVYDLNLMLKNGYGPGRDIIKQLYTGLCIHRYTDDTKYLRFSNVKQTVIPDNSSIGLKNKKIINKNKYYIFVSVSSRSNSLRNQRCVSRLHDSMCENGG